MGPSGSTVEDTVIRQTHSWEWPRTARDPKPESHCGDGTHSLFSSSPAGCGVLIFIAFLVSKV